MTRNSLASMVILGLAVVGALVVLPTLLQVSFGLVGLLIAAVIWMLAGALAGRVLRGRGYGPLADIALGFVGGLIGTRLLQLIGLGGFVQIPILGPIIAGAIGAILLVFLIRLFNNGFAR
jgi:uncharacterized membrane protein YeaQ/YmgE (transglycosylase-associated protein family)